MLSAERRRRRELFFRDCQVIRVTSRVYGNELPRDQVREATSVGTGARLEDARAAAYGRERHFRGLPKGANYDRDLTMKVWAAA